MSVSKVGLVGVGNCASSLVQGLTFEAIEDVEVVSAFDVVESKVGRDLSEAIWAAPNNALRFSDVPFLGVAVSDGRSAEVASILRDAGTEILVSLLPTGSQAETETYAEAALAAGCAYINAMPATLARDPSWAARFEAAGLPLVGDDLKSGFGSTLIHRAVMDALRANGVSIESTYQVNVAGNEDFRTLEDPAALAAKQATKTSGLAAADAVPSYIGTTYIPHLADRKTAHIHVFARGFGATPIDINISMTLEDSPSAAPALLAAIRATKSALESGVAGVLPDSDRYMKAPPPR